MSQMTRFCTGCGKALYAGVQFCTSCGKRIAAATPSPPPQPVSPSALEPGMPFSPGMRLRNKYVVERRLGAGGMGRVYLARDTHLTAKLFALKEMSFADTPPHGMAEAVERFYAEAETLAGLNHPNIPQVFERFEEYGRYFMVMEYVEGIDLERLIDVHTRVRGCPLPEAAVARIAFQACDALAYLHKAVPPIIHRDIKPANMIVTNLGRLKVVDFGIARTTGNRHTQAGTVGYAPPEQYKGATEQRSDLYSLGATLHHLVTGQVPIPFTFGPCRDLNPELSEPFAALVAEMVAQPLDARPASAEVVWRRLRAIWPQAAVIGPGDPDDLVALVESLRPSGLLPESRTPAPNPNGNQVSGSPLGPSSSPTSSGLPCPRCGKPNRATGKFCTGCGSSLSVGQVIR